MKQLLLILMIATLTACGGEGPKPGDGLISKDANFDEVQALAYCPSQLEGDLDRVAKKLENQANQGNGNLNVTYANGEEMVSLFEELHAFIEQYEGTGKCKIDEIHSGNGTEVIYYEGKEAMEKLKQLRQVIATNLVNFE